MRWFYAIWHLDHPQLLQVEHPDSSTINGSSQQFSSKLDNPNHFKEEGESEYKASSLNSLSTDEAIGKNPYSLF